MEIRMKYIQLYDPLMTPKKGIRWMSHRVLNIVPCCNSFIIKQVSTWIKGKWGLYDGVLQLCLSDSKGKGYTSCFHYKQYKREAFAKGWLRSESFQFDSDTVVQINALIIFYSLWPFPIHK